MTKTLILFFITALILPGMTTAATVAEEAIKSNCTFSGYSIEKNKPQKKNVTSFGSDSQIVNSPYDFSSEIKKLPDEWAGPKGKIYHRGLLHIHKQGGPVYSLYAITNTSYDFEHTAGIRS